MLALLGAFDATHRELTLSELARRSGLHLSTAQRRATELLACRCARARRGGRYRIGLWLWEVGSLAPRSTSLREVALPYLEDLYVVTRENVQLAVRDGTEAVFVERIAGRSAVPVLTRVGGRFALHATGVGLVLLAHAPVEVLDEVLAEGLTRYTDRDHHRPGAAAAGARRRPPRRVRREPRARSPRTRCPSPRRSPTRTTRRRGGLARRRPSTGARPTALAPAVQTAARAISRAYAAMTGPCTECKRGGSHIDRGREPEVHVRADRS